MKNLITLALLTVLGGHLYAQTEDYLNRLEGTDISTSVSLFELKDGKYDDLNSGDFATLSTRNVVMLSVEQGLTWSWVNAHETEVDFNLTGYDDQGTPTNLGSHTLSVSYLQTGSDRRRDAHIETSGYPWISIEITAIRVNSSAVSAAPANVVLQLEVSPDRYYPFDTDLVPGVSPHSMGYTWLDEGGINQQDAILFHWDYIEGANEYDLEWTYVEAFDGTGNVISATLAAFTEQEFRVNSTRIRTKEQHYRIENTFEKGYLIYRIRGIGKGGAQYTDDLFGKWSTFNVQSGSSVNDFPHYISLTNTHESNKNWQYSAVYAEGGKKKNLISYFDGSLRNRQTVSILNTQEEAIVGETVYDAIGRPTVQILPVPAGENRLQYYENFNLSEADDSRPYSYRDFDMHPVGLNSCQKPTVGGLHTSSGAGNYYSPSAALRSKAHDYIPDAHGYAFTQVEYTPDNTGRIRRQSGVGKDFTIESDTATKYFYAQPAQEELDRLFGADVGHNSHYKKNMVIDANRQVSVTYVDAHGRTIATALAGSIPVNMDGLRNSEDQLLSESSAITVDLLSKVDLNGNGQITDEPDSELDDNQRAQSGNYNLDDILSLQKVETVVEDNPSYKFWYDLVSPGYTDACLDNGQTQEVFPYIYDLSISMSSDCGTELLTYSPETVGPADMNLGQGDYGTAPTVVSLDDTDGLTIDYLVHNVKPGTYNVNKKLQVNADAVEHFTDLYVAQGQANGCLLELEDFIDANEALIPIEGCEFDCQSCITSLGTLGEYVQQMFAADNIEVSLDGNGDVIVPQGEEDRNAEFEQEYTLLKEECDNLCGLNQNNLCTSLYQQMVNDVKPMGQYGAISGNMNLSVFAATNSMVSNVTWKNPSESYKDESGNDYFVYVVQNEDLTFTPDVDNYSPSVLIPDEDGGFYTKPDNIKHLSDFLNEWNDSWALSLVQAHPEYCYYDWCISDQSGGYSQTTQVGSDVLTSQQIDNIMMSIPTYNDAISLNYLNGLDFFNFSNLIAIDPFFNGNAILSNRLNNYYTYPNAVVLDVLEFAIFTNTEGYVWGQEPNPSTTYDWSFVNTNYPTQKDVIWNFYKGLILSTKQEILKIGGHYYAINNGCYNGCFGTAIGMNEFNPFAGGFWSFAGTFPELEFGTSYGTQPCDVSNYTDYKNKRPVWFAGSTSGSPQGDADSFIESSLSNGYNAIFEQTGMCPLAFDLRNLLNSIINDPALSTSKLKTSNLDLVGKPYFPILMQQALGVTPVAASATYYYDASVASSTVLSIDLGDAQNPCATTLVLPNYSFASTNNLSWNYYNDYLATEGWGIHSFATLYFTGESNGIYSFSIKAYIDRDLTDPNNPFDEVILTGSTCLAIGECQTMTGIGSVSDDCIMNDLGHGLLDLLRQVHGTVPGGLNPSSLPVTLSSDNFTDNYILNYYSTNSWDLNSYGVVGSNNSYEFVSGLHELNVNINWGTLDESLITGIQGMEPTGSNSEFYLHVTTSSTPEIWDPATSHTVIGEVYYLYNGTPTTNRKVALYSCGSCADPEVILTQAFGDHLSSIFSGTGVVFGPELEAHFGSTNLSITTPVNDLTTNTVSYSIISGIEPFAPFCEVELTVIGESIANITSVVSLGEIKPYVQGGENGFALDVEINTGEWVHIIGTTSCLPIKACPCSADPQLPTTCESAYQAYTTLMSTIGGNYQSLAIGYPDFCQAQYINHHEDYLSLINNLYNAFGSGMDYISLDDYIGCRMADWTESSMHESWIAYNELLTTHSIPTIPYSTFAEVGNCTYCLDFYIYYRENALGGLKTIASICGLVPKCPGLPNDMPPPIVINTEDDYDCIDYLQELAVENAQSEYETYIQDIRQQFIDAYVKGAIEEAIENFKVERPDNEYHYTLYYYDQAGNLVRTVPPKGVERMDADINWPTTQVAIGSARLNYDPLTGYSSSVLPDHTFATTYAYNALSQLVWQHTPDGGESRFWYDALGRIVASQNAKQETGDLFSYTRFDAQGRVTEAGQLQGASTDVVSGVLQIDVDNPDYPNNWTSNRTEITHTIYDATLLTSSTPALNYRNRIGSVIQQETLNTDAVYRSAYHYEYDVHGNVSHMQQDYRTNPSIDGSGISATMDYEYDLISGNVKQVKYRTPSEKDLLYHRYYYDADNRITEVETSRDGYFWNSDAEYIYFDHGPLARVEIGNDKVQGIDYTYTIQGWLKGVNATVLDDNKDMGKDGSVDAGFPNRYTGRDAFGFALSYYDGDYTPIRTTTTSPNFLGDLVTARPVGANGLFNGNIAQMVTAIMDETESRIPLMAAEYTYDQLNRIKTMDGYLSGTAPGTNYNYASATGSNYASTYKYDHNGNLTELTRKNSTGTLIDDFDYHYNASTNQLNYVADPAGSLGDDLDNQSANNYTYDEIGQLIGDEQEEIQQIVWTVTGKVAKIIHKSNSLKPDLEFRYDPMGNRIVKIVRARTGFGYTSPMEWKTTIYARDAQGNTMATYDMDYAFDEGIFTESYYISELNLYGSSRLGMIKDYEQIAERIFPGTFSSGTANIVDFSNETHTTDYMLWDGVPVETRGDKSFELTNHLGNVLAVVTDRKIPEEDNGIIAYYTADVVSYSDYYPGGMMLPGRSGNSGSYRYLYQGMEQDPEISGEGNSYTTLYRQYDPRLMRWKSVDPLKDQMPWISPYAMNFNNPLVYNDTDGDIPWPRIVNGGRFTSAFGTRIHPTKGGLRYHAGIDLAAPLGSSIRAAASGTVVYAGARSGYGNVVIIDHGNGYYSQYAHMTAEGIYVKVGERVNNGQVIAAVGNEGESTGPHLHLEFHRMTDPFVKPQQLTPSGGSEPGTSFDPRSIPDLHEKLNGAPERLTEKEAKEWKSLVAQRDRLATRIAISQEIAGINNTFKKDNSFRMDKISKLQGKLEKTENRIGELRSTNASRYTPIIEVGNLEGGEIVRD